MISPFSDFQCQFWQLISFRQAIHKPQCSAHLPFMLWRFFRQLGGLTFGFLADRIGRVKIIAITIWLMAGATALIGALPTHSSVGIAAPAMLVFCRLLQGFAMGGETATGTSYILEVPGRTA